MGVGCCDFNKYRLRPNILTLMEAVDWPIWSNQESSGETTLDGDRYIYI